MKKFKFKFESVLKVRKIREEEALRALGGAQGALQERIREKSDLLFQFDKSLGDREKLAMNPNSVVAYQTVQSYIVGTKQRLTHADQAIVRANRAVEKALRVYLNTKRQTRAMELLYEKSFSEFKQQLAKLERKELDDLTIMRSRMERHFDVQDQMGQDGQLSLQNQRKIGRETEPKMEEQEE